MNKVQTESKIWIIGSIFALILLPIIFIVAFALGIFYEGSMSFTQDNLSSWVTALATVSIAVLTIVLAKETWSLRKIQLEQIEQIRKESIRPSINFILKSSPSSIRFVDLNIINNGNGSAHDIRFEFSGENHSKTEIYEFIKSEFMKLNIVKNGILSLGVNERRSSHVINFNTLNSKFGEETFETTFSVKINYKDIEGKNYNARADFDFSEYIGIHELGSNTLHAISKSLKDIHTDIKKLANTASSRRLEVNTYNSKDRKIEDDETEMYFEECARKHKNNKTETS